MDETLLKTRTTDARRAHELRVIRTTCFRPGPRTTSSSSCTTKRPTWSARCSSPRTTCPFPRRTSAWLHRPLLPALALPAVMDMLRNEVNRARWAGPQQLSVDGIRRVGEEKPPVTGQASRTSSESRHTAEMRVRVRAPTFGELAAEAGRALANQLGRAPMPRRAPGARSKCARPTARRCSLTG
jgi:hypothetical protein